MSNRPAPRKSSLAGSSPVAPPATKPAQSVVEAAPVQQPAVTSEAQPAATASPPRTKPKYPPKVSFYQDPEDTARVRGAILHTQVSEGARGLSQFVNDAVMEKVAQLEAKYNNGEPFPAVGARELPQGRPMGE